MTIRRACAIVFLVAVSGCMLMPIMPRGVLAAESGIPRILKPEAREEFERLLYRYDSFWDDHTRLLCSIVGLAREVYPGSSRRIKRGTTSTSCSEC